MKVEYLGHSCFKLTESTGVSVITDPYSEQIGYAMPKDETCDYVTLSHGHYDHNNVSGVSGKFKVIDKPAFLEEEGIIISGIPAYHDDNKGEDRGSIIIYKYRMDGVDVCHLGDIGHECNIELIEALLPVNVLFIPVGGNYTIDADMAFDFVEKLMPDIVIPMHYKTKSLNLDIDKVYPFVDKFDEDFVEFLDGYELEIDRKHLDSSQTKVIVLKRKKD